MELVDGSRGFLDSVITSQNKYEQLLCLVDEPNFKGELTSNFCAQFLAKMKGHKRITKKYISLLFPLNEELKRFLSSCFCEAAHQYFCAS